MGCGYRRADGGREVEPYGCGQKGCDHQPYKGGAIGHKVEAGEMNSGVHTIVIAPDGLLLGGADPRREGQAMGE